MSLNAVLVDRARRLVDTPYGAKVEGSTQFTTVAEAWFKCRLTIQGSPETDDPQGARRRVPTHATVLAGPRDLEHGTLTLLATDRLEVSSKQLGRAIWNITEDPAPLRKKRKLIGWTATIVRVEEHEFVPPRV